MKMSIIQVQPYLEIKVIVLLDEKLYKQNFRENYLTILPPIFTSKKIYELCMFCIMSTKNI